MRLLLKLLGRAILALLALLVVAVALVLGIEFTLPLDAQREAIATAASQALGGEVRISGPLRLITGWSPGVEVGGLQIAGEVKGRRIAADIALARVRLGWRALLAHEIRLADVTAEGAKLCVSTDSGAPPAERTPHARPDTAWRMAGIDTLRIQVAALNTGPGCTAGLGLVELRALTLIASEGEAVQIAASGTIAGDAWQLDLRGPTLQSFADRSAPIPFKLAASAAEGRLTGDGKLLMSPLSAEADVVFNSPQFVAHIRPLGAPFKDFGPLSLRGHVQADANRMTLRLDEAGLIPGVVRGDVSFDWSGPLPRLAARARTDKLDIPALQRWLADSIDVDRLQPGRLQRSIIAGVRASEGSLVVEAGQVAAGRAVLDAVVIDGTWREGRGRASFGARLGAVDMKGEADADVRSDELSFAATAHTGAVALDAGKGMTAAAARIDAKLSARGRLGAGLAESLRAAIGAPNAVVSVPRDGGEKLSITLDTLHADWLAKNALAVTAAGAALGERFNARLEGADAPRLFRGEPWQLSASGDFGPLRLKTAGTLALGGGKPVAQFDVTAAADGLGSLVPGAMAKLPLDARGRIELAEAGWRVDIASLRLGRTQGRVQANGGKGDAPLAAEAVFEVLDLASLGAGGGTDDAWERQWLPRRLAFPDADIAFRAARVVAPGGVIAKAEVNPRTRGGRLEQAPFTVEMDGATIRGNLGADLRQDNAQLTATIEADGLEERHFGEGAGDGGIRFKAGNAKLSASSTGNRLRELAANAEARVDVRDLHAAIERRGKGPGFEATLSEAGLSVSPGRPTQLKMSGTFAGQPLSLEAGTGSLSAWLPPGRAPYSFTVSGSVAGLDLAAKADLPASGAAADLALDVRIGAARLDALNELLNADLPPVGPFKLEAVRRKSAPGEAAAELKIALGESRINGRIASRRSGDRPAFDIDLTSSLLRLEDLGAGAMAHPPDLAGSGKASKKRLEKDVKQAQALLDEMHMALRKFDARLRLDVLRITAGGQETGRAEAAAKLESGRLQLAPFRIQGVGGSHIDVDLDADMAMEDSGYRLGVTIDRLRYGQLMKNLYPDHPTDGELSLRLKLSGHGAIAHIVPTLEGSAGLVVFPSGQPSVWLDKWGGGLLRNVGTNLDVEKGSNVNCAVATFDIAGGRAKSTALMLDSTRVRAAGELAVDLGNGTLQGQIASKSKRPELFTASVPVTIGGTLAAPKIAPLAGSLALTAARYYYFAYAFLFDAVTTKNLAEDGRPDCTAAYERLAAPAPKERGK